MIKHLVDIERLSKKEIINLIDMARGFKSGTLNSNVAQKTVAMMFCENSTRTKCSFEMAANKLGMHTINFETANSSLSKGESLKDTIENLYHIGIEAVVIRHSLSGIVDLTISQVKYPVSFVNAGDGNRAHPTQALLDFFTMTEKLGDMQGKKVVIIGDIKHSRVAKSNIALLSKFGVDIHICCPAYFRPEACQK